MCSRVLVLVLVLVVVLVLVLGFFAVFLVVCPAVYARAAACWCVPCPVPRAAHRAHACGVSLRFCSAASPPSATPAETLARCSELAQRITVDAALRASCRAVRENCWLVPLRTKEYFKRCIWVREVDTTVVETCRAPPALANKTRAQLTAAEWKQCVSKTTDVREITLGEAQPNPLFDLLFS